MWGYRCVMSGNRCVMGVTCASCEVTDVSCEVTDVSCEVTYALWGDTDALWGVMHIIIPHNILNSKLKNIRKFHPLLFVDIFRKSVNSIA